MPAFHVSVCACFSFLPETRRVSARVSAPCLPSLRTKALFVAAGSPGETRLTRRLSAQEQRTLPEIKAHRTCSCLVGGGGGCIQMKAEPSSFWLAVALEQGSKGRVQVCAQARKMKDEDPQSRLQGTRRPRRRSLSPSPLLGEGRGNQPFLRPFRRRRRQPVEWQRRDEPTSFQKGSRRWSHERADRGGDCVILDCDWICSRRENSR